MFIIDYPGDQKCCLFLHWSHYSESGETAILLTIGGVLWHGGTLQKPRRAQIEDTGEPYGAATVALWEPSPVADAKHVWLRTWGGFEFAAAALQAAGAIEPLDRYERTGHCLAQLARLTDEALAELALHYASEPHRSVDRDLSRAKAAGRPVQSGAGMPVWVSAGDATPRPGHR